MDRRSFVGLLGGMGAGLAAAAETEKQTRFFVVQSYKLKAGTQLPRMHEFFKTKLLPQASTVWSGPKLFLEAIVAPHMPQILAFYGFTSLEEFMSAHAKTFSNPDVVKGFAELENGPEPPAETSDSMLLETAPYSPQIVAGSREKPRIFEMRVYHSPTYRQLAALHERFAGPEIKIFHRSGIHPILYSSTLIGPNNPNLTYLIPFDSLADREKAWAVFGADPEWVKVRKESVDKNGQISSVQNISLWKATDYSPVQ